MSLEYGDGVLSSEEDGRVETSNLSEADARAAFLAQFMIFNWLDMEKITDVTETQGDGYTLYEFTIDEKLINSSVATDYLKSIGAHTANAKTISAKIIVKLVDDEPVSFEYKLDVSGSATFPNQHKDYTMTNGAILIFGEVPVIDNGGSGSDMGAA